MREIATSVEIAAKPDRVWKHLAAFRAFDAWNPFITAIDGAAELGARISATLKLHTSDDRGRFNHVITAKIVRFEHEHEIRWAHGLWLPGLLRTEHWFRIAPKKGGVKFHQNMRLEGFLSGSLKEGFFTPFRLGFEAMNQALKDRVEALESGPRLRLAVSNDNAGLVPFPGGRNRGVG